MADRKISDLTALTTPAAGDYLPIIDISEPLAANKNKRITIEELLRGAPDGTAAAPGIAFESDPNTGIYRPGADQVAISTNGTGRLFVSAGGNIGVQATPNTFWGSDYPSLQIGKAAVLFGRNAVNDQTTLANNIFVNSANQNVRLETGTAHAYRMDSGGHIWYTAASGTGSTVATMQEYMRLDSSGRLGLGTSSPGHRFHVVSADTTTPGFFQLADITTTLGNSFNTIHRTGNDGDNRYSLSAWQVQNTSGLTQRAFIGARAVTGAANYNPLMVFGTTTGSGTYDTRMVIDGSGRVGVGTSSPSGKLDIVTGTTGNVLIDAEGGSNFHAKIVNDQGDLHLGSRNTSADTYLVSNRRLYFRTGPSESNAVYVSETGNVGVGTTGPADKLSVAGSSATDFRALTLRNSDGTTGSAAVLTFEASAGTEGNTAAIASQIKGVRDGAGTNGGLEFWTANAGTPYQRARITSSGQLLVGTSSARANFFNSTVSTAFQVEGTSSGQSRIVSLVNNATTNDPALLVFGKSNGSALGSNTLVSQISSVDTELGVISFQGNDATQFVEAARITASVDGTPGANDMPGRIVLSTTKDGQSSPTAAVTIDSSQRLLVGTSSSSAACRALFQDNSATNGPSIVYLSSSAATPADGAGLGLLRFSASNHSPTAQIVARRDGGTWTAGSSQPSRLEFSTTADGASSPTERMRITSAGVLQIADAGDITVGTTTGTKIGTATTQKLGFWNATPAVQPAAVADATDAASVITQLNDLLAKLRTLGIIAT